jgi:hypothetical protein
VPHSSSYLWPIQISCKTVTGQQTVQIVTQGYGAAEIYTAVYGAQQ